MAKKQKWLIANRFPTCGSTDTRWKNVQEALADIRARVGCHYPPCDIGKGFAVEGRTKAERAAWRHAIAMSGAEYHANGRHCGTIVPYNREAIDHVARQALAIVQA